jgi:hypothetical protein
MSRRRVRPSDDGHRQGLIRITRLEPSEERIQRFGGMAVVSVRMEMPVSLHAGVVWRPEGWRIVAGHVSAVVDLR